MSGTQAKRRAKKKKSSSSPPIEYILLGMDGKLRDLLGKTRSVICHKDADIRNAMKKATTESLWISPEQEKTDQLLQVMNTVATQRMGSLFMFKKPRPKTLPFLHAAFQTVIGESPSFETLPTDQFAEVVSSPIDISQDLFIGGTVDQQNRLLSLVRGNRKTLVVPLSIFHASGVSRPNFGRFSIGEYGHSVVFGEYEASADYILYAVDPDYRKRRNAKRRLKDIGFGPSLRRLRILKGLKQSDFANVNLKTIARLERGEVGKPHETTLRTICKILGVTADEIETY